MTSCNKLATKKNWMLVLLPLGVTVGALFSITLYKYVVAIYLSAVAVLLWIIIPMLIWGRRRSPLKLLCMVIGILLSLNLLNSGFNAINSLSVAIGKGDLKRIKNLIAKGQDVNSDTSGGQNMLTWACWYPYPNKTIWSDSPLVRLTSEKQENRILEILEILIENGADINVLDQQGSAPIHYAATENYGRIIRMLLDKGANVDLQDSSGDSALSILAGHFDSLETVRLLIAKGCNVNVRDNKGNTPLHDAIIFSSNVEIVKILLRNGADINAKNRDGKTPLSLAEERNITAIANFLRQHGAKE